MMSGDLLHEDALVDRLVDEISERARGGEAIELLEYERQYPEIADRLRRLVPAIVALEQLHGDPLNPGPQPVPPTSSSAGRLREGASALPKELEEGKLGDFRLVRQVGRGGMGVVYEAQQISLRRRVALKVLPMAGLLDERQVQRFQNEASAAAGLHHPNIVPVYSVGCERGVHYLAMQFIEGRSLAEVIQVARAARGLKRVETPIVSYEADSTPLGSDVLHGGSLVFSLPSSDPLATTAALATAIPPPDRERHHISPSPDAGAETVPLASVSTMRSHSDKSRYRTAANLIQQAAAALDHAHSLGVVHRDIKPSNLLLDARGNIWVADFGLAHLEGNASLTMTGDLLGTLRYMSPEQATGRRDLVDHRSDIYSLGVTLYELLTLQPAFPDSSRAVLLRAVIDKDPLTPRSLDAGIPRDLETILLKAMAKEPPARYGRACELAEDLRRFLAGEPIEARRPVLLDRIGKWGRRHRAMVIAGALFLVAVTIASIFVSTRLNALWRLAEENGRKLEKATIDQQEAVREAQQQAALAESARKDQQRQHDRADYRSYVSDMRLVNEALNVGVEGLIGERIEAYIPRGEQRDYRGWEWHYLNGLYHRELAVLRGHEESVSSVAWSPDGDRLASASSDGKLIVWDAEQRKQLLVLRCSFAAVAWSADGRWIAAPFDRQTLRVWDAHTGLRNHDIAAEEVISVDWSSAGDALLYSCGNDAVAVWNPSSQSSRVLLPGDDRQSGFGWGAVWSPNGQRVAACLGFPREPSKALVVLNVDNGHESPLIRNYYSSRRVSWSPDGRRLATLDGDESCRIWDADSGERLATLPAPRGGCVAWNPESDRLAFRSPKGLSIWDVNKSQLLRSYGSFQFSSISWSKNNRIAVGCSNGDIKILDPQRDPTSRVLPGHLDGIALGPSGLLSWNSRGNRLISLAEHDEGLRLWNAETGEHLRNWPAVRAAQWIDDNRLAITARNRSVFVCDADTGERSQLGTFDGALSVADRHLLARVRGTSGGEAPAQMLLSNLEDGETHSLDVNSHLSLTGIAGSILMGRMLLSPAGDLLAVRREESVLFLDTRSGQRVSELPTTEPNARVLFSPSGAQVVLMHRGKNLTLWTRRDGRLRLTAKIDMPRNIPPTWSPDERQIAVHTKIYDAQSGALLKTLTPPQFVGGLTWNPEGTRIAGYGGPGVPIWDAETGEHLLDLLPAEHVVRLSWSPDGRSLACACLSGSIRILDAFRRTGKEVTDAEHRYIGRHNRVSYAAMAHEAEAFSRLGLHEEGISAAREAEAIYQHNLRWAPQHAASLQGLATSQYLLVQSLLLAGQPLEAITAAEKAVDSLADRPELRPDPAHCNRLAWLLATSGQLRPLWAEASKLANSAVERQPAEAAYWNTLGLAEYRAERYPQALEALSRSTQIGNGGDAFDWFLLAMTYWRLDEKTEARQRYDAAVAWMNEHASENDDLERLRAEAASLLGVPQQPSGEAPRLHNSAPTERAAPALSGGGSQQ